MMIQGSQEWLDMRKKFIGASDAPIIMGVSPWKTKLDLWKEKTGQEVKQFTASWMQAGIDNEPKIRDQYILMRDLGFEPEVIFHSEIPYMMASLDGLSEDRTEIIEIKNAGEKDHEIARTGRVPDKYYPQLQHQIIVAESVSNINLTSPLVTYLSHRKGEILIVEVKKNKDYCLKLLREELLFMEGVTSWTPPIEEEPKDEVKSLVNELKLLKIKEDELKSEIEEKKNSLIKLVDNNKFSWGGVKVSKVIRKGNINYNKVPQLEGVNLEEYRNVNSEFVKITIGENNEK